MADCSINNGFVTKAKIAEMKAKTVALAEARRSSGRAVLESVACDYQAEVVLGRLSDSSFKGSHSTVCGLFGAIAACVRELRRFRPRQAPTCSGWAAA